MQLNLEPIVKHLSPSQLWTSIEVNVRKVMATAAVQHLQEYGLVLSLNVRISSRLIMMMMTNKRWAAACDRGPVTCGAGPAKVPAAGCLQW